MLYRKFVKAREIRNEAAVSVFDYLLFKQQHDRRQNKYDREYAQHNALCHDKADIKAKPELHKAQGKEAEHRCQRASHKRRERHRYSLGHGVLARRKALLFLGIAVNEEN